VKKMALWDVSSRGIFVKAIEDGRRPERIREFFAEMRRVQCSETETHLLRHYVGMVEIPRAVFLVMELCQGPDLLQWMSERCTYPEEAVVAPLVRQTMLALDHLHTRFGALHRDIKPENLMFRRACSEGAPLPPLVLIDFGLTHILPAPCDHESIRKVAPLPRCGTPLYFAPECWQHKAGPPSDIWAVGLVAYSLLSLDLPFKLLQVRKPAEAVAKGKLEFPEDRGWLEVSDEGKAFVSGCVERVPYRRPTAAEALASDWLTSPGARGDDGDSEMPAVRCCRSESVPQMHARTRAEGFGSLWQCAATECEGDESGDESQSPPAGAAASQSDDTGG